MNTTRTPPGRQRLTADRLREIIMERSLTMPGLPAAAARIASAAGDSKVTFRHLAEEIATDPSLAARLMRVANSSLYGSGERVDQLIQAVARLGIDATRRLVLGLSMKVACSSSKAPESIRTMLTELWSQSVNVASIARVIARGFSTLGEEEAMLAGLTQRIGVLPILTLAVEMPQLQRQPALLNKVIASEQAKIGSLLLRSWRFPESMAQVPLLSVDLTRRHEGPPDYSDIVTVASTYALSEVEIAARGIDPETVPAFAKLGILAASENVVLASAESDLSDTQQMLG